MATSFGSISKFGIVLFLVVSQVCSVFAVECGTTIGNEQWDLSPLTKTGTAPDYYVRLTAQYAFWVNFCSGTQAPCGGSNNGVAVCLNQSNTMFNAGAAQNWGWAKYAGNQGSGISIIYKGGAKCNGTTGSNRQTSINVVCAQSTPGSLTGGSVSPNCIYALTFKSIYGCPKNLGTSSTGGSSSGSNSDSGDGSSTSGSDSGSDSGGFPKGGWFLIAFFTLAGVYFIGGGLYRKYAMHKEGSDIVPQLEFWKDLPYLIKDGIVWTFHKVKGKIRGEEEPLITPQ